MTHANTRREEAAIAIRKIYDHERRLKGSKPDDTFLIIAFAVAKEMALAGQAARSPSSTLSSAWQFLPSEFSPSAAFSSEQVSRGQATLDLFTELGSRGEPRHAEQDAFDLRVVNVLADQWNCDAGMNDSAAGIKIGCSHTTIRNRKKIWCTRVMARLRVEFPYLFGRPYNTIIADAQKSGARSLTAIAAELTARRVPTPSGTGHQWHARQVSRLIDQAAA